VAIVVQYVGASLFAAFGRDFLQIAGGKGKIALQRALNHTGPKARTQVIAALTPQTGLRRRTIASAVKVLRGDADLLSYVLETRGGDIGLKHFNPRETRAGVSAAPRGQRAVYAETFQRAGWWRSGRVVKPGWNGQVFRVAARVPDGMDKFKKAKSGVFIPDEMLTGRTVAAWQGVIDRDLAPRVRHELARLL
jgi:hypothetical protein